MRFWSKNDAKNFIVFLEVIIICCFFGDMSSTDLGVNGALMRSAGFEPVELNPGTVAFCDSVIRFDGILLGSPNPQELEGIVGEFMISSHFRDPSNASEFLTTYVTNHRDVSDQTRHDMLNTIQLHQPQSNNDVGNE